MVLCRSDRFRKTKCWGLLERLTLEPGNPTIEVGITTSFILTDGTSQCFWAVDRTLARLKIV